MKTCALVIVYNTEGQHPHSAVPIMSPPRTHTRSPGFHQAALPTLVLTGALSHLPSTYGPRPPFSLP